MNLRTRVKICGITRIEDGIQAAQLGVDAIGLVFYAKSPRNIDTQLAQAICNALPGFVSTVALFLNPDKTLVQRVIDEVPVDILQFHGTEPAEFCAAFSKPYIKALGIAGVEDVNALVEQYSSARSLLLDSHSAGKAGGTGEAFDWNRIPFDLRQKIILAGGLNPDNIAQAVRQVQPYAVDLSSGVESAPGIKNRELMMHLMQQIKSIDYEIN